MLLYSNNIPSSHLRKGHLKESHIKTGQVVPEQMISETVVVYKDAIPYIRCEIQSTIQHESAHRKDEEKRNEEIVHQRREVIPFPRAYPYNQGDFGRAAQIIPFSEFSSESRTEPLAEREEEDCKSLLPPELSPETVSVNLYQLFEEAKTAAKIDTSYKNDIKAGTLDPHAQGMYLMQDLPDAVAVEPTTHPNEFRGFDGTLWIDIRKIIEPFIAEEKAESFMEPPTFQDDGIQADLPDVSKQPPSENAIPATPFVPTVPGHGVR